MRDLEEMTSNKIGVEIVTASCIRALINNDKARCEILSAVALYAEIVSKQMALDLDVFQEEDDEEESYGPSVFCGNLDSITNLKLIRNLYIHSSSLKTQSKFN